MLPSRGVPLHQRFTCTTLHCTISIVVQVATDPISSTMPGSRLTALIAQVKDEEGRTARSANQLSSSEIFWRDHQPWLHNSGYTLRSRYQPDWRPSWKALGKHWTECEDGHEHRVSVANILRKFFQLTKSRLHILWTQLGSGTGLMLC